MHELTSPSAPRTCQQTEQLMQEYQVMPLRLQLAFPQQSLSGVGGEGGWAVV